MDIDYNELFGIGEEEQEPAVPAAGETAAEETTAPEETGDTQPDGAEDAEPAGTEAEPEGTDAGTAETSTQSPEDNAKYAAARRKAEAERDAAIEKAQAEARAYAERTVAEALKAMGMQNPYSGEPIDTKDKLDAYVKRHAQEQKTTLLRRSGMSEKELGELIEDLPEVKEAREAKKRAEDAEKQAREMQARASIDRQIEEIGRLDPTIKSIADLTASANYQEVYDRVKQGYTLMDAYKLANWDRLQKNALSAAQQAARNAGSKAHMAAHSARGTGTVTVPAEVIAEYRQMMPGITDAEITAHYNKYKQK